jgi:hypothetical protein
MIELVIQTYRELNERTEMNFLPVTRLLNISTLLAKQTPEEESKYWEIVNEISRTASKGSVLEQMRFLAAAFLSRSILPTHRLINEYQTVEAEIQQHGISALVPSTQVLITLLLTLQRLEHPELDLYDRSTELLIVYKKWRQMHPGVTSGRLMPLMTIALHAHPNRRQLIDDVERVYLQLVSLGMPRSGDTARLAWAMVWHHSEVEETASLFNRWIDAFYQHKFIKVTVIKHALTLSLLGIEPEDALDIILYYLQKLEGDKAFRWHSRFSLLHPAVQIYLQQNHEPFRPPGVAAEGSDTFWAGLEQIVVEGTLIGLNEAGSLEFAMLENVESQ